MLAFAAAHGKCGVTTNPGIDRTDKKLSGIKRDIKAGYYLSQAAMRATASRISSAERA
jgi:hypothetical protein